MRSTSDMHEAHPWSSAYALVMAGCVSVYVTFLLQMVESNYSYHFVARESPPATRKTHTHCTPLSLS